jgi:Zn finger protein HypA/HybF involved in hydrogenase expression
MIVGFSGAAHRTVVRNRTRFINRKKPKKCCANCSHVGAETTTDVACCNCCEDMEFYDELPADLCIEFED